MDKEIKFGTSDKSASQNHVKRKRSERHSSFVTFMHKNDYDEEEKMLIN